jgi:Zn-dependent protease with chaperone function
MKPNNKISYYSSWNFRLLLYLFIFPILTVVTSSCSLLYFSERTVYNPYIYHQWFNNWEKIMIDSNMHCDALRQKWATYILSNDSALDCEVQVALKDVLNTYKQLVLDHDLKFEGQRICAFKEPYFDIWFALLPPIEIRKTVIASEKPEAKLYPNGEIFLASSLVDRFSPVGVENFAQLAAILSHEVIHIGAGHILYQWATIEAYNKVFYNKIYSGLTQLTGLLPLSYFYSSDTPNVYKGRLANELIEYLADFGVVFVLLKMGYSPQEYLHVLIRLKHFATQHKYKLRELIGGIDDRIECLERMLKTDLNDLPPNVYLWSRRFNKPISLTITKTSEIRPYVDPSAYRLAQSAVYWKCALGKMSKEHKKPLLYKDSSRLDLPMEIGIFPLFNYLFYYDKNLLHLVQ